MSFKLFKKIAKKNPNKIFLIDKTGRYSYLDAFKEIQLFARRFSQKKRCAFYAANSAQLIIGLLAAAAKGVSVCLLNRQSSLKEINETLQFLKIDILFTDCHLPNSKIEVCRLDIKDDSETKAPLKEFNKADNAEIVILTTGTTGKPKAACYRWEDLTAQVVGRNRNKNLRWLLTYNLNHFAGLQVLLYAITFSGTLLIPSLQSITNLLQFANLHGVNQISATPTFWRIFVACLEKDFKNKPHLRQITIGGEPVTEDLLCRLSRLFPHTPISQVFATTELGSCFSVKDNQPGFPVSFLNSKRGQTEVKIESGELFVKTKHPMSKYIKGRKISSRKWIGTGDLVQIRGERVLFLGRKSEVINVGGYKVHPVKVESAILNIRGVKAAKVYGIDNKITGKLVAVDLMLEEGYQSKNVIKEVQAHCFRELDRYHQPRHFKIIKTVSTINSKIVRKEGP